ncbi:MULTISPECIES: substrate binding domain-containing protein [unclassified Ensifer]|uniref:substrate binding domain-containing protein n=1 Tax=unclassified Ensifer TaxID=2633371 RepID=UPI000813CF0D|nr:MULTISPECIES: substrate binding domain-containing protein [unclassified Ensifer]OCP22160.1 hypothetical protein BC363_04060 [Ensifer sp. LC384]OCP27024.1 hypothetical protein BC361_14580 [Ensifer sp. LC54]
MFRLHGAALDVDLTDVLVDLAHSGVDVALRIARAPGANLIARKIAPVRMIACASPGYLARRGTPRQPSDLGSHETLSYSYLSLGDSWMFYDVEGRETQVRIHPVVHATNGDLLRALALAGGGVIVQPDFIVEDDIAMGRLVPLLEGWHLSAFNLYAVYLSRRHLSPKVRVFIDYLVETLGKP